MGITPNSAVTDVSQSWNYASGRPEGEPNKIIIHHWGGDGQRHDVVVRYLCREDGDSSAHYVASAGRVTQLVSDNDRAWHAGPYGNPRGIGIECRPEMSDADFETVAILIAAIRDEWGDLPLSGHSQYMATSCPGRWLARLSDLSARAEAIRAAGGAPMPSPSSPGVIQSSTHWYLEPDGIWGIKTATRCRTVLGVPADAAWEGGPGSAVGSLQYFLSWALDYYRLKAATGVDRIAIDHVDGPVTIGAFQAWYNASGIPDGHVIPCTGVWDEETVRAMQITLNHSWAGARALAVQP